MTNTSRAAVIRGFDQLVSDLGGNPHEVARDAGLNLAQLHDPDLLLSSQVIARVLGKSALVTGCDHFGLELAKRRDLSRYLGILGEIPQSAATLGEALNELFKLMSIHTEATLWQLRNEGEVSYVIFSLIEDSAGSYTQIEQLVIALFWRFAGFLTAHQWQPTMVNFTFAKPADLLPYKRVFNTPVVFDADFCGVVFHSSDLNISLSQHDEVRHDKLFQFADSIKSSRPRDLQEEVRILIRKNLELQLVGEEYLTRFFPFEKRTLQRKLSALGTSYRELLHDVRIAMAMDLLSNSDISITRLAERLCYADLANFTKAFGEHTGTPPSVWRSRVRSVFDSG
ncbi:MAG: AraC family transcriptional regulator [Proteobacteria bacterium]|nr:AraC family transcriptional regulator [Pseudomonadota bacterium]